MNDYKANLALRILPPEETNKYQVIELEGDMDKAGLASIKEKLEGLVKDFPCQYLVFDFAQLNYINSEGIGFLIELHSHLTKLKKTLVFTAAKEHVKDVFSVIGILQLIEYFDSLDSFKQKIT